MRKAVMEFELSNETWGLLNP